MSNFIKVIEIWTPIVDKRGLFLSDALYGDYEELKNENEHRVFNYNEGLPGKAWSMATPQITTGLSNSYFQRKGVIQKGRLKVGIAIPVFSGEFLIAVIVFLCNEEQNQAGAIELWAKSNDKAEELALVDGYYGSLKKLESASRSIRFSKGNGLPGSVWDFHIPMLTDMSDSSFFKRASAASIEGITCAIGLPFINYKEKENVITFLSAFSTPIARRFDIWLPDNNHNYLFLHASECKEIAEDISTHKARKIKRCEGLIGQTWSTGIPVISRDLVQDGLVQEGSEVRLSSGLVMPIIAAGFLKAIVVFMF